ncbi:hypothetical protein ACNFJ7_12310 [Sphingomonas sp. HT-1]|jgi:hypothetical protein|uniref:hypothetical protein n=1 Tax=unclassified Sphingomonas TaxID=196159 RepID=UPI0002EA0A0D|nr:MULTISPECIES: hypothetical protein [unclassified Sphingomonas]
MDLSSMQGVMVVIGPIILAAALIWAMLRNKTSRRDRAQTEEAARRNYEEHDAADRKNG